MSYRRRGLGNGCPVIDLARNACQLPGDAPGQITPCTLIRECDPLTGNVHWQYTLPGGSAANANIWDVDLETSQAQYLGSSGAPVTPYAPVQVLGAPPVYAPPPAAAAVLAASVPVAPPAAAAVPPATPPAIPVYATGYWSETEPVRDASWWDAMTGRFQTPIIGGVSNWLLLAGVGAALLWGMKR